MHKLRLILGDQLNSNHSWFGEKNQKNNLYVMMELRSETDYAKHHIQKVLGFFAAMREFKNFLDSKKLKNLYLEIDDKKNKQDFIKNLKWIIKEQKITEIEIQEADEYRLDEYFALELGALSLPYQIVSSEHFLAQREDLVSMFGSKDKYLMESFYRRMRQKYNILMDGKKPLHGKWNLDAENRKKLPKTEPIQKHKFFKNDVSNIYQQISKAGVKTIGNAGELETFSWAINRKQALQVLDYFSKNLLHKFGTYQDAMTEKDDYVYHSRLSFALNTKILSPLEVIEKVIAYYFEHEDEITFAQVEGFVRQILGWREFVRCFYWTKMPKFADANFFKNKNELPEFYWTGDTKMNCLNNAIRNSLDHAYAHHIQRLMITGNFALLAEVDPAKVDEWYLGIYIDALEWVEMPNTRAMSQWADGGDLATKPYVSSGNYVKGMSDYCDNCHYDVKTKYGESKKGKPACPFNSFYWDFLNKHQAKLRNNMRMSMVYRVWDKMDEAEQACIKAQAQKYKKVINTL